MRELKIKEKNYRKMLEDFDYGIREIYYNNPGTLENYFRFKVEDGYIIDWYWSSQTSNTYFVDEDITVYHISDYNVNCSIDNYLDECFYDIKEKFEEKYKDDEDALNSHSKWEDFREEYYSENEEDIIFECTYDDKQQFMDNFCDIVYDVEER